MKLEWRGRVLRICRLPAASMGRLAACAPYTEEERLVLAALLAGARVLVERDALEYRRYRETAPPEVYRYFTGLERRLKEMGISVVRLCDRQGVGYQKSAGAGGADLSDGECGRNRTGMH